MKKTLLFLLSISLFFGCKKTSEDAAKTSEEKVITADDKEKTAKQSDGLTLLKGDFLYLADAAVLQTHREVYGVVIDDKMHELATKAKAFKTEEFDMVSVEVRGKISPKPEGTEGWPYIVEIKEILNVSAPEKEGDDVIKIGN